jgi:GTPase SAR1 family protein
MVVGDSGVGKTSLIKSFLGGEESFLPIEPTNNVDIYFKKIKVKDGALFLNVNIF